MRLGLLLIVTSLLNACTLKRESNVSGETACPAAGFAEFVAAYQESVDLQKRFTVFPLPHIAFDTNAEPEPKPVAKMQQRDSAVFPLIPNRAQLIASGLILKLVAADAKNATATLVKEDTDYQVTYFFSKEDCWKLVEIQNDSL